MEQIIFKTVWRRDDDLWSIEGEKITDEGQLEKLKKALDESGPILVEHWHYCGSAAPDRRVINEFDDFRQSLRLHAKAGDAIHVWDLAKVLRDENILARGKSPAEDGTVPKRGAY